MTARLPERPAGPDDITRRLGGPPTLIGMVHLLPLPGAPRWRGSMVEVVDRALTDAAALVEGGMDALLVENYGDIPFFPGAVPPETLAAMALAVAAVRDAHPLIPVGVNVLRNDTRGALGLAAAAGATFVRVNVHVGAMFTDQGVLEGRAHEMVRERERLCPDVLLATDVHVKHATPPPGNELVQAARDTRERGLADLLILSGEGTGEATDPERVRRVREALPHTPLWIGSGVAPDRLEALAHADGAIVGSALHHEGRAGAGIEVGRVRRFVEAVRG